jgi:hypothetical protein
MEKPSYVSVLLKNRKDCPVERNPVYTNNVEKPLVGPLLLKHMKGDTLERTIMHVNNVTKPSFI